MKYKIAKVALASTMAFGVQAVGMTSIFAAETTTASQGALKDGVYTVKASLMKATDITVASGSKDVLKSEATLEVLDGKMYVTVEFQSLPMGNAIDIEYYNGGLNGEKKTPSDITYRVVNGTEVEKTVKIPVEVNENGSYGSYIHFKVDAMMNFMPGGVDSYIAIDVQASMAEQLSAAITSAKAYSADAYTAESFATLQTAMTAAETALSNQETTSVLETQYDSLQAAVSGLVKKEATFDLADGSYELTSNVLKTDGVSSSMAAGALQGATIEVKNNQITAHLSLGAVSMMGQTAYIDRMEYEDTATGAWKEAVVTAHDEAGNVTGVDFVLPQNVEKTNVKFYYGGSSRGSDAILYLGLSDATPVSTSVFQSDGTYTVTIALWNATSDQLSMASSALDTSAKVIVENGTATMYVSSKKMTMGTITAYLQELKIKTSDDTIVADIISKDSEGNPTMFAFALPSEESFLDVLVNPHVAMMGNQDIPARLNIDYTTLVKVSDEIQKPGDTTEDKDTAEDKDTVEDVLTKDDTTTDQETSNDSTETSKKTENVIKNTGNSVQTFDTTQAGVLGGLFLISFAGMAVTIRKSVCKKL